MGMRKQKREKRVRNRKSQDGKEGKQYREMKSDQVMHKENAERKAPRCKLRDTLDIKNGERKEFIFKE